MTAGQWTFTSAGLTEILNGTIDLTGDFKVGLLQSTSNISTSSTTWAGVTNEVAAANGYTTGGIAVDLSLAGTNPVELAFVANPVFAATGGNISARWAALYQVGGNVLAFYLLDITPADLTITDGNTYTVDSDGDPNPIFTFVVVTE